jgi:hypothetical protein
MSVRKRTINKPNLRVPAARRFQIGDVGCVNECVRELPSGVFGDGPFQPPIPQSLLALVGFKLFSRTAEIVNWTESETGSVTMSYMLPYAIGAVARPSAT